MLNKLLSPTLGYLPVLVQTRPKANTVNFFQRRTADVLWKTVTAISTTGAKRGRNATRQSQRPMPMFYKVGSLKSSPLRVRYPGLNAPFENTTGREPMFIEEQTEPEKEQALRVVRNLVVEKGKMKRKRNKEKLTSLERGFSGGTFMGQKLGPPPTVDGTSMDDFQCVCLHFDRICRMDSVLGRRYIMRALVFVGNGKGIGGYGMAKSQNFKTNLAISRAIKKASRKLFHVELYQDRTLYQDFFAECRNTRIYAQRMVEGFGVQCHPRLIKICELLGIKDIYARVEGSSHNYHALTYAFITGLLLQETHQSLAERTRLNVVEMSNNRMYFPKIVASPLKSPVKQDYEMTGKERLKLDDYYGEGRHPLRKAPRKEFFENTPAHLHAVWRKHPFRNMEQVIIRMLADDQIKRWTRRERYMWAQRENERVMCGERPLPEGLGLANVVKHKEEAEGF